MPSVKVNLNVYDLKLIHRLAKYENTSDAAIIRSLVRMSLGTVRSEERAGWYYGPIPKELQAPPQPRPVKVVSRFEGWTKEQRDAWILNGIEPGDEGVTATGA